MQFYEYTPQTQANNNTTGHPIKLDINANDCYSLPSRSYISIEGQLKKTDDSAFAATDEKSLITMQ